MWLSCFLVNLCGSLQSPSGFLCFSVVPSGFMWFSVTS
jgi:hypothetical protein